MNSGVTAERVYDEIKRRILTRWYRPGDRLEPGTLADDVGSSATPVREVLHLLAGERLLEARPGTGFHVALIDEPTLEDLYDWSAQVLLLASRQPLSGWDRFPGDAEAISPEDAGIAIASLFERIAGLSGNIEHLRETRSTNDRLHAARLAEAAVFEDWRTELSRMKAAFAARDVRTLRRLIVAYHRRRHRSAATLARALYRLQPDT